MSLDQYRQAIGMALLNCQRQLFVGGYLETRVLRCDRVHYCVLSVYA